jgi:hypothetical protein
MITISDQEYDDYLYLKSFINSKTIADDCIELQEFRSLGTLKSIVEEFRLLDRYKEFGSIEGLESQGVLRISQRSPYPPEIQEKNDIHDFGSREFAYSGDEDIPPF